MDILNKCKILSYNEEEFSENINFIIKDVKKWWLEKEVIDGKNEALNRYSKVEKKNSVFKIVNILKENNIIIARRTVTKYRESLKIPSSLIRSKNL